MNRYCIIDKSGKELTIEAKSFIVKDYGIYFLNTEPNQINSLDMAVGYCSTDCVVIQTSSYENR